MVVSSMAPPSRKSLAAGSIMRAGRTQGKPAQAALAPAISG
jgi:hypothetical protein